MPASGGASKLPAPPARAAAGALDSMLFLLSPQANTPQPVTPRPEGVGTSGVACAAGPGWVKQEEGAVPVEQRACPPAPDSPLLTVASGVCVESLPLHTSLSFRCSLHPTMRAAATSLRPGRALPASTSRRAAVPAPQRRGRTVAPAAPEQAEAAPPAVEDCDENIMGFCSLDEGVRLPGERARGGCVGTGEWAPGRAWSAFGRGLNAGAPALFFFRRVYPWATRVYVTRPPSRPPHLVALAITRACGARLKAPACEGGGPFEPPARPLALEPPFSDTPPGVLVVARPGHTRASPSRLLFLSTLPTHTGQAPHRQEDAGREGAGLH